MKTKLTSVLTAIVAVVMLTITTQKSSAAEGLQLSTKMTDIKNFSKITANGNVEVFLTQGATEGVTVYDNYYGKYALVQLADGELRISSYGTETLQVWVQVDDLKSIEASGDAKIKSLNKISALDLSIELRDSATATLNSETITSKVTVSDLSSLDLSGSSLDYTEVISESGAVNANSFVTAGLFKAGDENSVI